MSSVAVFLSSKFGGLMLGAAPQDPPSPAARPWMLEPEVTLTNFALTAETGFFAYLLMVGDDRRQPLRRWFATFFVAVSVGSLAGGVTHGFFPDGSRGERILWRLSLIAVGGAALACWAIAARLHFSAATSRRVMLVAVTGFVVYCLTVIFVSRDYLIAIAGYLPAALCLTVVFAIRYARHREQPVLSGLIGLLLTFVATGMQQKKIGLHPRYFDHNALYHVIQAVALLLFFWSAQALTAPRQGIERARATGEGA